MEPRGVAADRDGFVGRELRRQPVERTRIGRTLAPRRTNGTLEVSDEPLESNFDLTSLLGIRDLHSYDVPQLFRTRQPQRNRLQVPIGVTETLQSALSETRTSS